MGFPGQEYWSALPFLSPGIFLTQGSNPRLLVPCVDRLPLYHWATREALQFRSSWVQTFSTCTVSLNWKGKKVGSMGGLPEVTSPNSARQLQPLLPCPALSHLLSHERLFCCLFFSSPFSLSSLHKAPSLGVLAICPPNVLSLDNVALFLPDTGPTLCSATLKWLLTSVVSSR